MDAKVGGTYSPKRGLMTNESSPTIRAMWPLYPPAQLTMNLVACDAYRIVRDKPAISTSCALFLFQPRALQQP